MEIVFEGIVLRPWSKSDAKKLALIADNKNIADNLRDGFPFPYSVKDARIWLESILSENTPPRFFAFPSLPLWLFIFLQLTNYNLQDRSQH